MKKRNGFSVKTYYITVIRLHYQQQVSDTASVKMKHKDEENIMKNRYHKPFLIIFAPDKLHLGN